MKPNVNTTIKDLLSEKLLKIEDHLNSDAFCYYGTIVDGIENDILGIIEELGNGSDIPKRDKLTIILTSPGGSAFAVERYVNIIRKHYTTVDFIVPDYAYSSGTIFCMSGDNIFMDYFSVLGPIDPQVQNKEGKWVAALGYLDKVNDAIAKSKNGELTEAEFLWIKDLDLAELRSYEQARELTNDLLKNWLVKYKFKNWDTHETTPALLGQAVTDEEKVAKAEEIANKLNDNTMWKSHGRPINIEAIRKVGLKVESCLYLYIHENLSDMKKELTTDNFQKIFQQDNTKVSHESRLVKANDTYNKLVHNGTLKKRGYTLKGIDDIHLFRSHFNGY